MKLAAIADIHGNHLALEAVLADIDRQGVDLTVNLGDLLSAPLEAGLTADILMARTMPTIRGNHDRWLLELDPEAMGPSDRWAHDQLSDRHKAWLATLPETLTLEAGILLCHGTPASDTTYWLETVHPGGIIAMAEIERIEAEAAGIACPLILCAHTHIPRAVRLGDGRLVVNPGSVGCPGYTDDVPFPHRMQAGTPDACYAILEARAGRWSVSFRQVPYDSDAAAALAAERGRPDWASALATGWIR